jgi:Flp pilus assembly protein TadG
MRSGTILDNKITAIFELCGRPFASFRMCQKGAAAVEFALVALPLFALVFAILNTGIFFLASQQLESAVEQSGRKVLTGQVQNQALSQTQFAALVCQQIYALFNCNNLMVDMQTASSFSTANTAAPTLTYNASGQVTNNWSYNYGQAGDIVVLRVMYQWPVLTNIMGFNLANLSNGSHLMMATSVFKNEP